MSNKKISIVMIGIGGLALLVFLWDVVSPASYSSFNQLLGGPEIVQNTRHYVAQALAGGLGLIIFVVGVIVNEKSKPVTTWWLFHLKPKHFLRGVFVFLQLILIFLDTCGFSRINYDVVYIILLYHFGNSPPLHCLIH